MVKGLLLALGCALLFVFLHFLSLVSAKKERVFKSPIEKYFAVLRLFLVISLSLLPVAIGLFLLIPQGTFQPLIKLFGNVANLDFLNGFAVYLVLSFFYVNSYYIVDRSVSAKMMIGIENLPGKKATLQQIKDLYGVDEKYIEELTGMIQGGFVRGAGGFYSNTFKGSCYSRIQGFFKRYFRLGIGG